MQTGGSGRLRLRAEGPASAWWRSGDLHSAQQPDAGPGLQEEIETILLGSLWPQSLFEKAQPCAPALMGSLPDTGLSAYEGKRTERTLLLPSSSHTQKSLSNLEQKSVINTAQRGPASVQICTENRAAYRPDQHLMLSSLLGLLQ